MLRFAFLSSVPVQHSRPRIEWSQFVVEAPTRISVPWSWCWRHRQCRHLIITKIEKIIITKIYWYHKKHQSIVLPTRKYIFIKFKCNLFIVQINIIKKIRYGIYTVIIQIVFHNSTNPGPFAVRPDALAGELASEAVRAVWSLPVRPSSSLRGPRQLPRFDYRVFELRGRSCKSWGLWALVSPVSRCFSVDSICPSSSDSWYTDYQAYILLKVSI